MLRLCGKIISKRLSWDDAVVVAALLVTAVPLGCILASKFKEVAVSQLC